MRKRLKRGNEIAELINYLTKIIIVYVIDKKINNTIDSEHMKILKFCKARVYTDDDVALFRSLPRKLCDSIK